MQPHTFSSGSSRAGKAALLAPLLTACLTGSALAQKSDAEIRKDIEFARGLASRWTFVDLSEKVLARIEKDGVSDRMATELALVKCDVFVSGALGAPNAERRNQLFEQAIEAYDQFLTDFPQSARQDEAEIGLVGVSAKYARSLSLELEDAVGEEAEEIRKRQEEVLLDAVALTGDLISNLKTLKDQGELPDADERKLYNLMLDRGNMLLEIAKNQEDGSANFIFSMNTLEELVFTAGEGTPYALRAYNAMGDNFAAQGLWEDASIFYREVVAQAIPKDRDEWERIIDELELDQGAKDVRWLFVQLGTEGLIRALRSNGNTEEAVEWALHIYNTQRREGFTFIPQGYLSLLEGARALLDAGGWIGGRLNAGEAQWFATAEELDAGGFRARERASALDLALRIAENVNRDNAGNNLKVRAQRLISEVIDRPGVEVAPEVLLEAAMGAYNERDYAVAVEGFRRVLRAIQDLEETEQVLYAPKALYHLGRCFYRLDRPLEAAVTWEEAATRYKGDPEFDSQNAQGFYDSMRRLAKSTGAETFKALENEAAAIVTSIGSGSADDIVMRDADRLRQDKDYAAAITKYRQIPQGSNHYEKALVYIAVCEMGQGELEKARGELENYLGPFLNDPQNATTSPSKLQKRREARAVASFYRGLITNLLVGDGQATNADVIEQLGEYSTEFPEQDRFSPYADRMVALAYLADGDKVKARERLDRMVEKFASSKHTGRVARTFYESVEVEYEEAAKGEDAELTTSLLREMAGLMKLSNATDSSPSWAKLRRESSHWLDLGENVEAERVLNKLIASFENDTGEGGHAKDVVKYVKPDLAEALLRQQKATEAYPQLQALVGAGKTPTKRVAVLFSRSAVGWLDGDKAPFTVIPGASEDDTGFEQSTDYLGKIAGSVEKYSCDWIELKFELAYAYYVWGQKNTKHIETARGLVKTIQQDYGSGFEDVESRCGEDGDEARGDRLRRMYVWLEEKLR